MIDQMALKLVDSKVGWKVDWKVVRMDKNLAASRVDWKVDGKVVMWAAVRVERKAG